MARPLLLVRPFANHNTKRSTAMPTKNDIESIDTEELTQVSGGLGRRPLPPRGDFDRDGVANRFDRDRDGDGTINRCDQRPNRPRFH